MLGTYPLARAPLAARLPGQAPSAPYAGFVNFDVLDTVIAEYCNSPVLLALVEFMGAWLDGRAFDDLFYFDIWNLPDAQGYGLDVLGRIVGASRIIQLPDEATYIGFAGQPTAENWGAGIWFSSGAASNNVRLDDNTYRRVILAKALSNICGCTIPEINRLLLVLFPTYGNSYVIDNADGTLTFHFGAVLTPVDYAIVSQEGILPRPVGKRLIITQG